MKRLIPIVASLSLAIGGLSLIGCSSSDQPLPASEAGSTAGGNGAFGTNSARAGDYSQSNTQQRNVTNDTAGGNGAFGENPARPGDYHSGNN